jgi:hypothetical protein
LISVGERVQATIPANAPACWQEWDSGGRCRQHVLVAPQSGTLTATVTPSCTMDLFLVLGDRGRTIWSGNEKPAVTVAAGQTVGVVVMAYTWPQDFVLETSIQP